MGAVVEQIQQTYDLQVSGYYSQLQLVEEFLLHERELSLETDTNKNFFEAWEKESESTLIFLQENGQEYQQVEQKCGLICQVNFCWT